MRSLANPAVGYVGAVLGVIAMASVAVFTMHGMAAKAHRHWDADIDRIIARQQAKKLDTAIAARTETPDNNARPQIATLTRSSGDDDDDEAALSNEGAKSKKLQNPSGKKYNRRTERQRQHYIPPAFATVPKFAATAAATTTVLLRLR